MKTRSTASLKAKFKKLTKERDGNVIAQCRIASELLNRVAGTVEDGELTDLANKCWTAVQLATSIPASTLQAAQAQLKLVLLHAQVMGDDSAQHPDIFFSPVRNLLSLPEAVAPTAAGR